MSSLVMIHAERGSMKTWLALSVAHAIASGKHLLGWTVERTARVLCVDGEMPGEHLQKRLTFFGEPPEALFILSRDQFRERELTVPDLAERDGQDFLDDIIERRQIDVIVLDSLSTLIRSGVENEAESWTPVRDWMLKQRGGAAPLSFCTMKAAVANRGALPSVKTCSIPSYASSAIPNNRLRRTRRSRSPLRKQASSTAPKPHQ